MTDKARFFEGVPKSIYEALVDELKMMRRDYPAHGDWELLMKMLCKREVREEGMQKARAIQLHRSLVGGEVKE